MTQQRLSETDAEYEKRKKRVTATYRNLGFGLAHGSISVAPTPPSQYLIEYTWSADSYELNGSDEVIVDNKGTSGATNDLLLNTGEPIEVSSGQEFDIPVEVTSACVAYYNITTKAWVYQTTISSPSWTIGQGTFGIIATLDNEPDATDKTRLDAEPWQILNLWFEETTNLTSIVKADIQHLYNPNILQTSTLYDLADTDDITVPNYLTSMYENVDFNTVGVQTTILTLDGNGEITAMSYDKAQWLGNGYGCTDYWVDDVDFTLEYALKVPTFVSTNKDNGVGGSSSNNRIFIRRADNTNLIVYLGATTKSFAATSDDEIHIVITYNASTSTAEVFVDGVTTNSYITSFIGINAIYRLSVGGRTGASPSSEWDTWCNLITLAEETKDAAWALAQYNKWAA